MRKADPDNLRQWVEFLARDIGRRPATRPDLLEKACVRIAAELICLGYEVQRQPVPNRHTSLTNVIAAPSGSNDSNRPLLVVGAHYDSVSRSPGADDNASGVAGLLELARLLAVDPPPELRLVAFCPEEPPAFRTRRMGSYVYAQSLKDTLTDVRGMICLEMIGYFSDAPGSQSYPLPFMNLLYPSRGNFIAMVGSIGSAFWTHRVKREFAAATDLPAESLNAPAFVMGIDFSDHWSFNKLGYPAVMVTDTAFYRNSHYHLPSDLPETLDYQKMAEVVDGLTSAIKTIA